MRHTRNAWTSRARILLIDDTTASRQLLGAALTRHSFSVHPARSGRAAQRFLKGNLPDLVLLDATMPGSDGYQICERLKGDERTRHIPVILLFPSRPSPSVLKSFRYVGVDYMVKPYRPEDVVERIRFHLALRTPQGRLQQRVEERTAELLEANVRLTKEIGERIEMAEALAERDWLLRQALHIGQMGGWEFDVATRRLTWTDEMYVLFERDPRLGPPSEAEVRAWYRPLDQAALEEALGRAVTRGEASQLDAMVTLPSGRNVWHLSTIVPIANRAGRVTKLRGTLQDITQRKQAEAQAELTAAVFRHCSEGIMVCDRNNRIVSVNPAFEAITGYRAQEVEGKNPKVLCSGLQDEAFYRSMWSSLVETGHWEGEIWDRRKSGEAYAEWLSINAVKDREGSTSNYIGIFSDITERVEAANRIHHLAYHDPLTQLPNRILLRERVEQGLAQAERHHKKLALLYLDLDRFKVINDSLGHDAGDQLLKSVGARLKACVRGIDTVSRLGGDEFAVALVDLERAADVAPVAKKILESLRGSHRIAGQSVVSTPSMGVSIFPDDGCDYESLLNCADLAMYHAKAVGRGNYQFFSCDMNLKARERLTLETALRRALDQGEFRLHYQPQIDLMSGRIVGVEALLRWAHPERGLLRPNEFLAIAEETGLINPIGDWVLDAACDDIGRWRAGGCPSVPVSLNLSPIQLRQKDLASRIEAALSQRHIVNPGCLDIEITEQCMMQPSDATIEVMHELKEMGISLSVDDFGTGYSSLSYLKHFPISALKIDRSFVHDIDTNADDAAITTAIIAMARSLHLDVVAEGVESSGSADFLRANGCRIVQGFYFGQPTSADEVEKRLRANV